ncbi:MAG: MFS transporter [Ahrensia sp.]
MATLTQSAPHLLAARNAIYAAFFANGLVVGHWAPKIPVLVERLGITEATLGKMIILFGLGALLALMAGAWFVTKFGSRAILRWTSLFLAPSLVLLTLTPTVFTASLAMLWLGVFLGAMDNAMNTNGVGVEVELAKPVMSSYHGFWSLGGVAGGLTGGAMISVLGELGHAIAVAVMVAALVTWAWPRYLASDELDNPSEDAPLIRKGLPRQPGIYLLGLITLLAFAPEGTVIDWSALYLKDELGAPLIVSGYAVAAFSATMALMRLRGDGLRARYGDRNTFIASGLVAGLGLLIAGAGDGLIIVCIGFLIAGLGMANVVPVLFSTAGRYPGVRPTVGIAVITTFGYAGLLFIPAFVGFIAELYSIGIVYVAWGFIVLGIGTLGFVLPQLRGRAI